MTGFDLLALVTAFLLLFAVGGAVADSYDRRDARRRNQARRMR